MSDKELIKRGAEVVTGDLILRRTVVGHYRNGQFILTPEGANELDTVIEVQAKDVSPTARPKRADKKAALPQAPAAAQPDAPDAADPLAGSLYAVLKD
jgi:hypothetical protein